MTDANLQSSDTCRRAIRGRAYLRDDNHGLLVPAHKYDLLWVPCIKLRGPQNRHTSHSSRGVLEHIRENNILTANSRVTYLIQAMHNMAEVKHLVPLLIHLCTVTRHVESL